LHYPKYGFIGLKTMPDSIVIKNMQNNFMAPLREYNYIFNVSSWNLTLGDYARNFTKLHVELRCTYDLKIVAQIEINNYKSKEPMIRIPINEIINYTFPICKPDLDL